MPEQLVQVSLYALYAATVGLLFAMLFVEQPRARWQQGLTLLAGAGALALPVLLIPQVLGYPDPRPSRAVYDIIGWETAETDQAIYLLVERRDGSAPTAIRLPFSLEAGLALQDARERIGTFRELSVEVVDPDWLADPPYALRMVRRFASEDDDGDPP